MDILFRFENPWILCFTLGGLLLTFLVRYFFHKPLTYRHSMGTVLTTVRKKKIYNIYIYTGARALLMLIMALLIARPQWGSAKHIVTVDGIDIVLALDVSGSMDNHDFNDDKRSRFEVARAEAIRFAEKRTNDAIGLVLFGADALSRCPLTVDGTMVRTILQELRLGTICPDGTVIGQGLVTAANRLKQAKGVSKVIILLTDGTPTEQDIDVGQALEVVKALGIRVYTIGIGSEQESVLFHPLYGYIQMPSVNKELLTRIAQETGGHYYLVTNASEMRRIYDEIDRLERVEHHTPLFQQWQDMYMPIVAALFVMLVSITVIFTHIWCVL
jgi:Ca-activated chloride channel family protein